MELTCASLLIKRLETGLDMALRIPAPSVVVLIGPSRTGKTTWALEHFAANEVVSSDALRAAVGIDEGDQIASTTAFSLLNQIVDERLSRGLTTVIDTTGLNAEDRKAWIEKAHEAGLPAYAVLFEPDPETVQQLNEERPQPIPKSVLRKQLSGYRQAVDEIAEEGFDGVFEEQPIRAVTTTLTAAAVEEQPPPSGHTFGLILSRFNWQDGGLREQLSSIAARAEDAGFTDLWFMDHFRQIPVVGRKWEDIPEGYTALSYLAGVTSRVRLGVLVSGITHRHPVVLGKMMATLDVLSGGRAICGLGAAWDEDEHAAYGIDFPSTSSRDALLEDTLQMRPLLWGKGSPSFEGETFRAAELICYPRPIQDPIPIMVGGSGEKKTLRLVAKYADAANVFGGPDQVRHKIEVLHRHCEDVDRNPHEIIVSTLINTMVGRDQAELRERIHQLRDRNTSVEQFAERNRAGTVDDVVGHFAALSEAGADHSIVALPDVALPGSLETFADVIAAFE